MIKMLEPMNGEIEQEAATTKRVLERVPVDKLGWKPHPKSMSLGQLAMHVATIPGASRRWRRVDSFEVNPANFDSARSEEHGGDSARRWMRASKPRKSTWAG